MGRDFRGCYDIRSDRMILLEGSRGDRLPETIACEGVEDPRLAEALPAHQFEQLAENVALAREACPPVDPVAYRSGHLSPVYFGSALRNFGVGELLQGLARLAPPPRPQPAEPRRIDPTEDKVTGFVFKVQANMDPNHRDRVAFLRLCSGRFRRGMKLNLARSGKPIGVHSPIFFFAQGRELAEEALAGDIIGIPNHGTLRVGDTLSESEAVRFTGIPDFAPEILRRVRVDDPLKAKHLKRALESLAEEGVTQVFRPLSGSDWIVGVVGPLQLDVLVSRIEAEYGLRVGFEAAAHATARWIGADDPADVKRFLDRQRSSAALDGEGAPVFLARNEWDLDRMRKDWPTLRFSETKERS